MPTVTRTLKLARTSESEITALADILNDLETFQNSGDIDYYSDISTVDFSQYNTLCKFKGNSPEQLIEFICEQVSIIHFQRIIMNASVLLENCTDPDFKHLEFSPVIKRGFELVSLEKAGKLIIKPSSPTCQNCKYSAAEGENELRCNNAECDFEFSEDADCDQYNDIVGTCDSCKLFESEY